MEEHVCFSGLDPELPGQFPYTRGPHPTMYAQRPWTIRQVDKVLHQAARNDMTADRNVYSD